MKDLKLFTNELFGRADVSINGEKPWDIRVNHEEFYRQVLTRGSLGLG